MVIYDFVCKQNYSEDTLTVLRARLTKIFAFSSKYHLTTLSSLINSSYSPAFIMHLLNIIPEISDYSLLYLIKFCNTISITCLFWTVTQIFAVSVLLWYPVFHASCSPHHQCQRQCSDLGRFTGKRIKLSPSRRRQSKEFLSTGQHCAAPHCARTP